jgi:hypothetical protein
MLFSVSYFIKLRRSCRAGNTGFSLWPSPFKCSQAEACVTTPFSKSARNNSQSNALPRNSKYIFGNNQAPSAKNGSKQDSERIYACNRATKNSTPVAQDSSCGRIATSSDANRGISYPGSLNRWLLFSYSPQIRTARIYPQPCVPN